MAKIQIPEDRKFLFGWIEIEMWSGMSIDTLKKLIDFGLPGTLLHSDRPIFHKDNLNKFFCDRTNQALKLVMAKRAANEQTD